MSGYSWLNYALGAIVVHHWGPAVSDACSFLVTNKPMTDTMFDHANYYMRFRGPDFTNKFSYKGFTFVHNLLHLTGTPTLQPFVDYNLGAVSLFNGEIYNYKDFGADLTSDGYALLKAYREHDTHFPSQLDGEFAIVLVDFTRDLILISSDVFATKPVHYALDGAQFGVATYGSALTRLGFRDVTRVDPNTIMTITGFLSGASVTIARRMLREFDLRQYKESTEDYRKAFDRAVMKRTQSLLYPAFMGLSSGYDSGAIAASLVRADVAHYEVAVVAREPAAMITMRQKFSRKVATHAMINLDDKQKASIKKRLKETVEDMPYRWHGVAPNKLHSLATKLVEDGGGHGLSAVFELVKQYHARVAISGIGADEIVSDYAFNGTRMAHPASFGNYGPFPADLRTIFPCRPDAYGPPAGPEAKCSDPPCMCDDPTKNAPWTNFYGNAMRNFLHLTEYIGGSYGIESRYPFIDPEVVQEFLWLTPEVKNSEYKRPIGDYLRECGYPFFQGKKTGFGSAPDKESKLIKPGHARITQKSGRPMPKAPDLSRLQMHVNKNYATEMTVSASDANHVSKKQKTKSPDRSANHMSNEQSVKAQRTITKTTSTTLAPFSKIGLLQDSPLKAVDSLQLMPLGGVAVVYVALRLVRRRCCAPRT